MNIEKHYQIAKFKLFKICRSITGNGITLSLNIIKKRFPQLKIKKIKCGTKVFDWRVPAEWNVYDAYVLDNKKKKIIDFKKNNLHLMNFSIPIKKRLKKRFIKKNLYFKKTTKSNPICNFILQKKLGFLYFI